MLRLFEAGEGTEGAQAFDIGSVLVCFTLTSLADIVLRYTILTRIIEEGFAAPLYKQFIMQVIISIR